MSYKELCMTARNEAERQAELRKYRNYTKMVSTSSGVNQHAKKYRNGNSEGLDQSRPKPVYSSMRCYKCNKVGHLAKDCRMKKSESHGGKKDQRSKSEDSNQVRVTRTDDVKPDTPEPDSDNPLHFLVSSSDKEVRLVHISDEGS